MEARDIPDDAADVIVSDGFTGNCILKMYEGVALVMMGKLKEIFTKNLKNKIAASLILSDVKQLKQELDYNEYGGAPLMGTAQPVFKAHGRPKTKTIQRALRLTEAYVEGNVVHEIEESIQALKGEENA